MGDLFALVVAVKVVAREGFSNQCCKTLTNSMFISSGQENVGKTMEENEMPVKNKQITIYLAHCHVQQVQASG